MKRTILSSTFALVAIATALATQAAFASRAPKAVSVVASMEGQSCTTSNGRSGYLVSTGRNGEYECVEPF